MSAEITTPTGRWLVKLLRAVPRGKSLTDEQRRTADLIEKVLPKIEAEARSIPEGQVSPGRPGRRCDRLREALEAIATCGPSHDAAYWGLAGHPTIEGADCQNMAWARETARAALNVPFRNGSAVCSAVSRESPDRSGACFVRESGGDDRIRTDE